MGRQIFLTSKFSIAFWLTAQRHLQAKTGHTAGRGPLSGHRNIVRSLAGTGSMPLLQGEVSLSLRRAGTFWFTGDASPPPERVAVVYVVRSHVFGGISGRFVDFDSRHLRRERGSQNDYEVNTTLALNSGRRHLHPFLSCEFGRSRRSNRSSWSRRIQPSSVVLTITYDTVPVPEAAH